MGCAPFQKQVLMPIKPCHTVNGILKVTLQQGHLEKASSKFFDMNLYLILKMSNQQFRGIVHKKSGKQPLFNQSFQFMINSCYKNIGRKLQIQLWDESSINDKIIGLGIIDIDPIISLTQRDMLSNNSFIKNQQSFERNSSLQKKINEQKDQQIKSNFMHRKNQCRMKVFLNHEINQAGYINSLLQFQEQEVDVIGFRFIFANIRSKSTIFTTMHIWIQVIAGQQILQTHKQKDKHDSNPPSWQGQVLVFNIPQSLKHCIIRVMDDNKQIGRVKLSIFQIVHKKGDYHFTQQIEHGQTVSGILKFIVSVGIPPVMYDMKKQQILQTIKSSKINQSKIQPSNQNQNLKLKQNQQQKQRQKQKQQQRQKLQQRQKQELKQFKMEESNLKTTYNTHANQENPSRVHTLQNSNISVQNY